MSWLSSAAKKAKKTVSKAAGAVKSSVGTDTIAAALGVPGAGTIGKVTGASDVLFPTTNAGQKIGSNVQQQAGEISGVRSDMENQFTNYQKGMDATRSKYRADEDAGDKSYDQLVDENAKQAGGIEEGLAQKASALENEAASQAADATKTYTESVRPKMMKNMEDAMTLADYQNPNNQVQTAYRNLYNQMGQQTRTQGLADAGILAALGGQAMKGQMAGRALTGSQMAAMQGANLNQSGMAYQRAQQRMQDLQDQGIAMGVSQSDKAYNAGQQARRDFTDEEQRQLDRGTQSRAERQGYAREAGDYRMRGVERSADINKGRYDRDTSKRGARYGEDIGDSSMANQFRQGMLGMKAGDINAKYGGMNESVLASMNETNAAAAAKRGMLTAGMSSGAQLGGQMMGGGKSGGGAAGADGAAQGQAFLPGTQGEYTPERYMPKGRKSYYA